MSEGIYSSEKISEHIYKISEKGINNCFLAVGENKALLVDCGVGLSHIGDEIRKITDLPITLVATHAHADHIGGARQFEKLYVHYLDLPLTRYSNSFYQRYIFLKKHKLAKNLKDGIRKLPLYKPYLKIKTFRDGEVFDLGGVRVQAISTPGHTRGSCIFKIEEDKIILLGDNFIPMLFLHYGFTASLSQWIKSCELLLEKSKGYALYGGHGRNTVSREGILWQYEKAKQIVSQAQRNDSKKVKIVKNPEHSHLLIKYRTDNIL